MSLERTPIDICIGTCQRPEMLKELLQSLENQVSIENFIIRIIIVDNDTDKSAYPIVEAHQRLSSFQIDYDMEPEKGISFVRNRAIRKVSANYFAFIDDDEILALLSVFCLTMRQLGQEPILALKRRGSAQEHCSKPGPQTM